MDQDKDLKIIDSIAVENLSDTALELAEITLDTLLEDGVLRDIPIFTTLAALYRSGIEIRQQLFFRRVVIFLKELSNIPYEKRKEFVEKIESNRKQKNKIGETLILLIDRADSMHKPTILGRLMRNHILGKLSYEDAERLAFIVDRGYLSDINYLKSFTSGVQKNPDIAASLFSAGLLADVGIDGGTAKGNSGGTIYSLNRYGKLLLKYGL